MAESIEALRALLLEDVKDTLETYGILLAERDAVTRARDALVVEVADMKTNLDGLRQAVLQFGPTRAAASRFAEHMIELAWIPNPDSAAPDWVVRGHVCLECYRSAKDAGLIDHADGCMVDKLLTPDREAS